MKKRRREVNVVKFCYKPHRCHACTATVYVLQKWIYIGTKGFVPINLDDDVESVEPRTAHQTSLTRKSSLLTHGMDVWAFNHQAWSSWKTTCRKLLFGEAA